MPVETTSTATYSKNHVELPKDIKNHFGYNRIKTRHMDHKEYKDKWGVNPTQTIVIPSLKKGK